jgi:chromosome segregation ATPase
MPKDALADQLEEWREVLSGLDEELQDLDDPVLQELRDLLAALIEATQQLAAEQNSLMARRQAVTQQLRITRSETKDLVIAIRSAVKSRMGHRNESLVRFGIRPNRGRDRAKEEIVGIAVFPRPDLRPEALRKSRTKVKPPAPAEEP